ncbi:MAG: toprim domain-containing protein, partial [Pseudomonadota bacterium]
AHLAAFDPPKHLNRLYIAVDADPAGREAAATLEKRILPTGIETIPLHPVQGDFNDDLCRLGLDDLRAQLRSQLTPIDVPKLLEAVTS